MALQVEFTTELQSQYTIPEISRVTLHHPQNTKDNNGVGLGRNLSIAGGCFRNMPDLKANNVSHCRNHRHLVKLALKLNSHLPVKAVILWGLNHNNKP